MKRLLIALCLLFPLAAAAQVMTVRSTATDPDGTACTLIQPPFITLYHSGATVEICTCQSSLWNCADATGGSAPAFSALTTATNTTATMTVGTGASIVASGSGTITATAVAPNSVALTTGTTGNYAAGDAEAGAALTGDSATAFFSAGEIENAFVADDLTIAGGTIGTSAITLVQGVTPIPTAEGVIEWETDDDHIIVGDAVDQVEFVPTEDISGDITMDVAGVVTIAANSVALTTDTTGNYAAGDGEAGAALTGDSATSFFSSGTLEDARLPSSMAAKTLTGASVIQDDLTVGDGTDANWTLTVNRTSTDATFAWDDTENDWVFGGGGNSDGNLRLKAQSATNQSGIMIPVATPVATDWWIGGGSLTFNGVHDSLWCATYNSSGCNTSPKVATEHGFGFQLEATYSETASQEQSEFYVTFTQADTANSWRPFSGDVEYWSGGAKVGFGSDTNGRGQIDFSTSYAQYSEAVAPRQLKMEYTGASTFNANSQQGRSANLNVGIYTHNTFDGPELDDGIKIEMDLAGDGAAETVVNARMIEVLTDIAGTNYSVTTLEGLRFSPFGSLGAGSTVGNAWWIYMGDLENIAGAATFPWRIADQTPSTGADGNILIEGMEWNNGHLQTVSSNSGAADHFWRDEGNEFWRSKTDGTPTSATDGEAFVVMSTDDAVPVGDGTDYSQVVIPDCDDSSGNHLNYDTTTNAFSCGTSLNAGASPTWTGAHNFGGATGLEIPNGAAPTIDVAGEIALDTTDVPATGGSDQLIIDDGTNDLVIPTTQAGCATIESLADTDDDYVIWTAPAPVTITSGYCIYQGTGSTPATVDFQDGENNLMTMTDMTCADGDSAVRPTVQAVTAANALVAGESLAFNVTNTPVPATDKYTICFTYRYTRQ